MMKKLVIMMLALAMVFGVCSCQEKKNSEVTDTVSEKMAETDIQSEEKADEAALPATTEETKKEEPALPATTDETSQSEPVAEESESVTSNAVTSEPAKEETPVVKTASKETASQYIGQSVSALVAAIGQPKNKTYASSCIGDGEDGEWYYDGFTVYTYRENGTETVEDVF